MQPLFLRNDCLYIFIFCLLVCSCSEKETKTNRLDFLPDKKAAALLERAIVGSGGWNAWEQGLEMQFRKRFSLYKSDGTVEMSRDQAHHYNFKTPQEIEISWLEKDTAHAITMKHGKVSKLKAGQSDPSYTPQSALNAVLSSTFVIRLPFNLVDPSATISYGGKQTLRNGKAVEVLQVAYDPAVHENHSTPDIWWLYFDEKDALVGYKVQHADHISYVENTKTEWVNGLLMPVQRQSWRVDSLDTPLYLRADYTYSDYHIQ